MQEFKGVKIFEPNDLNLPFKLERILSPGAIQFRRTEIFPGLMNDDPRYEEVLKKLMINVHREFEPYQAKEDQHVLEGKNIYPGVISKLANKSGYYMGPCGVTPVTNDGIGKEPTPHLLRLIDKITRMCTTKIEPSSIELNSMSTSGMPDWERSAARKRIFVDNVVDNIEEFIDMWAKKDFTGLFDKFHFVLGAHQTFRAQQDGVDVEIRGERIIIRDPKERKVISFDTLEEVKSFKGIEGSEFSAMRVRAAVAYALVMNIVLRFMERALTSYQTDYDNIFKAKGADDICTKLQDCNYIVALDYSQFDQSIKRSALEALVNATPLKDWAKEFALQTLFPAMVVFGDSPESKGKTKIYGNPMDPLDGMEDRNFGLTSGHGWVSFAGKMIGTAQAIELAAEAGIIDGSDDDVEKILNGTHPDLVLLNTGDDNLFGFRTKENELKLRNLLKKGSKRSMVKAAEEIPAAYLGFNFIKEETRRPETNNVWRAVNRIESLFVNFWVPERGIGGNFRPRWPEGILLEQQNYGLNPLYEQAAEIRDKVVRDVLKVDYMSTALKYLDILNMEVSMISSMTEDERLFLQNPDRRHYDRIDMSNVRDEIKDMFFKTYPKERHEEVIPHLFNL